MDGAPADPPELSKALINWASMFEFAASVTKFRDLQDGEVLWRILKEVDSEYFIGELPEPNAGKDDNWIPRWQNLKHIDKFVISFIRDEMGELTEYTKRLSIDFKAIAIDASAEDSLQLLKLVFVSGLFSPKSNKRMIAGLSKLPSNASKDIADSIKSMKLFNEKLLEASSQGPPSDAGMLSPNRSGPSPEPGGYHRDVELEWEERLIEANSTIRGQADKIQTLHRLIEQYRTQTTELETENNDLKYQRDQGGGSDAHNEALDQLSKKTNEDRDYITELESEINTLRGSQEDMEAQVRRYKIDSDSKQKLRDELQMVKVERDDLVQKTKANDNLRKKIQTLQETDKSNSSLRQEIDQLQEELRSTRGLRDKCIALQKTNEENMKTIANGEQEIFDMRTTRRRIDQDLKYYQQRYEAVKDRHQRDADTIAEMEQKVRELEVGQGKPSQDAETLDDEFTSNDKTHADLRTKITELEKANAELRKAVTASNANLDVEITSPKDDDSASKQQLEALRQRYHRIEKQYLDVFQENIGLDAAVKDADKNVMESRPFIELRDRMQQTAQELEETKKRLHQVEGELSQNMASLAEANGRLASLSEDHKASSENVQKAASAQAEVLQKENERLSNRVESLQIQLGDKSSLLKHSLTDQGVLLKEDDELRNSTEARFVQEQITHHKTNGEPGEEELALSMAQRIESGRKKAKETEDQAKQVSQDFFAGAHQDRYMACVYKLQQIENHIIQRASLSLITV